MAFRLLYTRCEEIKKIVVDTFEKYNIRCVPISGFEIATKLGATIIPYSVYSDDIKQLLLAESEDGFSVKKDGVWYIYYNDTKQYGRINNTIMHENGHIVLDHSQESELAEAEARFFAKYALAPPVLIQKLQLKDAYQVHERFDISIEAAGYAFAYYRKWLTYGDDEYTDYERKLLQLFKEAV